MRTVLMLLLVPLGCRPATPPPAANPPEAPVVVRSSSGYRGLSPQAPKTAGQVGLNLMNVAYYSSEIVFADAFKTAKPWISQATGKPYGEGGPLEQDEWGNVRRLRPGQWAETLLFADIDGHYPAGDYTCLYEGKGELEFQHAARATVAAPGRVVVRVTPKNGPIGVKLKSTDPADPVRNLRLFLPGLEKASGSFTPEFLASLKGFSVVRFMDWGRINNSKVQKWGDRTTPRHLFQGTERGVAVEYMLELAAATGAAPWLCVPHLADDDYVRQLGALIAEKLPKDRQVYLEWSNETWNSSFEQAAHCQRQGKQRGLSANDFEAQLKFSAARSAEVFRMLEPILGRERMVRVLAPQSANPWSGGVMIGHEGVAKNVDAIAIAPYFGNGLGDPGRAAENAKLTVEQVLEFCKADIEKNAANLKAYQELCGKQGVELIAYEGGQHLVGYHGAENNEALTKLFHAANRHPGMAALYEQDRKGWESHGGGLFCHYASVGLYSKWGSWGLREWSDQDPKTAPKWQAVQQSLKK